MLKLIFYEKYSIIINRVSITAYNGGSNMRMQKIKKGFLRILCRTLVSISISLIVYKLGLFTIMREFFEAIIKFVRLIEKFIMDTTATEGGVVMFIKLLGIWLVLSVIVEIISFFWSNIKKKMKAHKKAGKNN